MSGQPNKCSAVTYNGLHVGVSTGAMCSDHRVLCRDSIADANSKTLRLFTEHGESLREGVGWDGKSERRAVQESRRATAMAQADFFEWLRRLVCLDYTQGRGWPFGASPCHGARTRTPASSLGTGASQERAQGRQPLEQSRASRWQPRLGRYSLPALWQATLSGFAGYGGRGYSPWGTRGMCGL